MQYTIARSVIYGDGAHCPTANTWITGVPYPGTDDVAGVRHICPMPEGRPKVRSCSAAATPLLFPADPLLREFTQPDLSASADLISESSGVFDRVVEQPK